MQQVKNVTVYTFLYPILGGDSPEKSKQIWCAKDNTKAWRDWMLEGAAPMKSMGQCDVGASMTSMLTVVVLDPEWCRNRGTTSATFRPQTSIWPGSQRVEPAQQRLRFGAPSFPLVGAQARGVLRHQGRARVGGQCRLMPQQEVPIQHSERTRGLA